MKRLIAFLLLLHVATAGAREIAITIDDLPWAQDQDIPADGVPDGHDALVAAVAAAGAPVVGFVNEAKLEGRAQGVAMLRDWLRAGAELGNHGYAHLDLHAVGVERWTQDVLRGERVLRPLLAERGQAPRWFRHPFLRAGRSAADKQAVERFLGEHGYRIAPVTVDNSDWIWAGAYRRLLHESPGDARLDTLRTEYVAYMLAKLDYWDAQAQALLGRPLPQVWLLHANALNADAWAALIAGARERGWRFIALEDAMRDEAYARADGYTGAFGPSWIHRWAMAAKKPRAFYAGEPATPAWVLELAGVDSE